LTHGGLDDHKSLLQSLPLNHEIDDDHISGGKRDRNNIAMSIPSPTVTPSPAPRATGAADRAVIQASAVTKVVRGHKGQPIEILSPIDLEVRPGEFVALVGPSGCGKSTLLNILSGLIEPSSGSVSIFDRTPEQNRGRIGYMFQTDALLPWRSVLRNVQAGLDLSGVPRAESRQRAQDMLAQLGLTGFEHHYPAELSGGMRQRASLARTWVTNPNLILMDEPFGALDSQTKLVIQSSFLLFWEKHRKTVVLVTHDLEEAVAMSDRVLVMSARPGKIKAEYRIELPRPRSVIDLRADRKFIDYWRSIWGDLETEAVQAMQGLST
jgi:NitT/TauT family transport system ATP-binding protein